MPNPVFTNPLLVMVSRLIKSCLALLLCIGGIDLGSPEQALAGRFPGSCNSFCVQREARKAIQRRLLQERTGQVPPKSRRKPAILRVRGLTGSVSAPSVSVTNTSFSLLWNAWGLGQSDFSYTKTGSGKTYTLTSITNDLSYTFGSSWTLTLGAGTAASGFGTITDSSETYSTSKVSGSAYSATLGVSFGFLEILVGSRTNSFTYSSFTSASGTSLSANLPVSGAQTVFGIGFVF